MRRAYPGGTSEREHQEHDEPRPSRTKRRRIVPIVKGTQLVEIIKALQTEMARLKESLNLDSKTLSKPPSTDLLKKSEKKKPQPEAEPTQTKRKPGGQPGHEGKTCKGFGRCDRIEVWRPEVCRDCGGTHFAPNKQLRLKFSKSRS